MRKFVFLAVAAIFVGFAAKAQTPVTAINSEVFKQQGGERTVEVMFHPFNSEGAVFSTMGIRLRQFNSANTAIRGQVDLGYKSDSDLELVQVPVNGVDQDVELRSVDNWFNIGLQGGYEWHHEGTNRLSPYCGLIGMVDLARQTSKIENPLFDNTTDLAETTVRNGQLTFGVGGVLGADYYFSDGIYIGTELNYIISFKNDFDTVTESDQDGVDDITDPNGGEFCSEFGTVGAIRVGFQF